MKRLLTTLAALTTTLALTGCVNGSEGAPPSVSDPRDGRVTLTWSNCLTGFCIYDWKICLGPDLQMRVNGDERLVKGSPECESRAR